MIAPWVRWTARVPAKSTVGIGVLVSVGITVGSGVLVGSGVIEGSGELVDVDGIVGVCAPSSPSELIVLVVRVHAKQKPQAPISRPPMILTLRGNRPIMPWPFN